MPMLLSVCAISAGAALGALARWLLGLWLNPLFPAIPPGTLAANWLGSFLMGLLLGLFAFLPVPQPVRLGALTGFLGAFTTFSTFASEMSALLQEKRLYTFGFGLLLHVAGSIALFLAGWKIIGWLKRQI